MKFKFDEIVIYCIRNEKLFLIPTGELKKFNVNVDIDPVLIIDLPTTLDELTLNIKKCFELCWSSKVEKITKGPGQIENALKVKSYKKVVEMCDNYSLVYHKDKKIYSLSKGLKAEDMKGYYGLDFEKEWKEIDYEFLLKEFQD